MTALTIRIEGGDTQTTRDAEANNVLPAEAQRDDGTFNVPTDGPPLGNPPAEGRPPGLGWSHKRRFEFKPEIYVQTARAGAHTNGGFRDKKQRHRFKKGEFGKKGGPLPPR